MDDAIKKVRDAERALNDALGKLPGDVEATINQLDMDTLTRHTPATRVDIVLKKVL